MISGDSTIKNYLKMIHILTTGGTIEGLDYTDDKGITTSNVSIAQFLQTAKVRFAYEIEQVFKKDSRSINENDRKRLLDHIQSIKSSKILITHGTFTMEDTAEYLGKKNLAKTIVLTGSFILGSSVKTDAPFNLGFALHALQYLGTGVYVAMNGCIFNWNNVTKNEKLNIFETKSY